MDVIDQRLAPCFSKVFRLTIVASILNLCSVSSTKVLMYVPTLSYSHVAFNGKLADILVVAGYNVTFLLINIDVNVRNHGTELAQVRKLQLSSDENILSETLWKNPGPFEDSSILNPKIIIKLVKVSSIFLNYCRVHLAENSIIHELKRETFDIATTEQYDACGFSIFNLLGIKRIIWLSATGIYRPQPLAIGVNYPLSYVPELLSPYSDRMSFLERVGNVLVASVSSLLYNLLISFQLRFVEKQEIFKNVGVIISNTSPLIDFPAPISGNILQVAGFTVSCTNRSISTLWSQIADASSNGFIIMSFGSIAKISQMDQRMKEIFFETFASIPQINFIIKYENLSQGLKRFRKNVVLAKWIPQIELMSHRRFIALITHGGWSSILESLMYNRPMILIPLFADHFKNAQIIKQKRIGLIIKKEELEKIVLREAIVEIVENPIYRVNCMKYSKMLSDISKLSPISQQIRRFTKSSHAKYQTALQIRESLIKFHEKYYLLSILLLLALAITASL